MDQPVGLFIFPNWSDDWWTNRFIAPVNQPVRPHRLVFGWLTLPTGSIGVRLVDTNWFNFQPTVSSTAVGDRLVDSPTFPADYGWSAYQPVRSICSPTGSSRPQPVRHQRFTIRPSNVPTGASHKWTNRLVMHWTDRSGKKMTLFIFPPIIIT